MTYDVDAIRADFPILSRQINGHQIVYLDSANTSQKPQAVVAAIATHYLEHNANVARAMHTLGAQATAAFEGARAKVADFIGVAREEEIIFTKNASEALNLAAHTLGAGLGADDEIVISVMEHHSNIVPWQLLCERTGAKLRWFDITADGRLDIEKARAEQLINERTAIVSLTWVSNVLGTINPIAEISEWAHSYGAIFVVDGSQGVPHLATASLVSKSSTSKSFAAELPASKLSAPKLSAPNAGTSDVDTAITSSKSNNSGLAGIDMLAFTGHKMLAPTGIGVLWGRYDLLSTLPPFLGGGEMIEVVRMTGSTYAPPPHRFEAGTPPIAQAVGLAAAIDYLNQVGMSNIAAHEQEITAYALQRLQGLEGLRILGPATIADRGGAISFVLATKDGLEIHPHDVMQFLDARSVAVRGGHHCARPLHERLGVQTSSRISSYLYTTTAEIDQLVAALEYVRDFFGRP